MYKRQCLAVVAIYDLRRIDFRKFVTISRSRNLPGVPTGPIRIEISNLLIDIAAEIVNARITTLVARLAFDLCLRYCPVKTGLLRSSLSVFAGDVDSKGSATLQNAVNPANYLFVGSEVYYFKYNLDFTDYVRILLRKAESIFLRQSLEGIVVALGLR